MIKQIFIYGLLAAIVYYVILAAKKRRMYTDYLTSLGIPNSILNRMSSVEIKAAALYLKRYGKTNIHFAKGDKDYDILASIRSKYGIFT